MRKINLDRKKNTGTNRELTPDGKEYPSSRWDPERTITKDTLADAVNNRSSSDLSCIVFKTNPTALEFNAMTLTVLLKKLYISGMRWGRNLKGYILGTIKFTAQWDFWILFSIECVLYYSSFAVIFPDRM
ncbi:hypothetical protein TNCV_2580081 [Trichonephila clavipes]|uniref:Uncharacterized protein n=1 Tax=Trichonephila clavipes TaxID=2585209 RepID=A0A8X6S7K2_TRICX|nr:hypothetical protein TNCV_2580081 [Trichonephila clavipes]